MAAPAAQATAGSLFGLPGITKFVEMADNNDGLAITPVAGSQQSVTGLIPMRNTDVVFGWDMEVTIGATYTAGTTTLALSQLFPWNFIGPLSLNYQGMYNPIRVTSGFDAAVFQSYRSRFRGERLTGRNLLDTSPVNMVYSNQSNLTSASNYTTGSTSFSFCLDLPASLWFDRFWPLGPDGKILSSTPLRARVSPQYMAGTSRYVVPSITLNGLLTSGAGTTDKFPIYATGSQSTPATVAVGTSTLGFQRRGVYQPQTQADAPVIFNWQYTRQSQQFSVAGKSVIDLTLPLNGQILSVWVYLYDPSANTVSSVNYGAPITINNTNVTKCQLLYGAGLYRYQDTPARAQRRFFRQHQFLPAQGLIIWDMAQDDSGNITNEAALNTMTTSGVTVHLETNSALSSTAYAVVGVEALQYTETP